MQALPQPTRSFLSILVVAVSAIAFLVSTGVGVVWPLAWLAPIPALVLSVHRSWRAAAIVAFTASLLGDLTLARTYGPGAVLIFGILPAMAFAAATLAARAAARRMAAWLAVFAFPTVLTSYEFLFSLISPNGTFWSLGYSQTDFLPLLQVVSLTGLWGVVFVLTLVPSAAALVLYRRSMSPLISALAILLLVLGYGTWRLLHAPEPPIVRAGLAATDRGLPEASITTDPAMAISVAAAYADRVAYLAARGAQIIVFPEKMVGVTSDSADAVVKVLSDAARAAHATVIAGLSRNGVHPRRNMALVISQDGTLVLQYEKRYLVPMIETTFASGNALGLFAGPEAQWGVAICKDLDFPAWSRAYGRHGVRFLAVPAWDFVRDARMHSRMAVMRGVENGFAIARSAQEGLVTVSDAYGRILVEQSSARDPMEVQAIAAGPGATFYTHYGDWFGWVNVLMMNGLVVGTIWPNRTDSKSSG
jgi:apolipoprotein N-acyltransferase